MQELLLTNIDEALLQDLQKRALSHGRTPAEEAKVILAGALRSHSNVWAPVDAIFHQLASSGRTFHDSAELLREDRDR